LRRAVAGIARLLTARKHATGARRQAIERRRNARFGGLKMQYP
jgi:hypothetical protein